MIHDLFTAEIDGYTRDNTKRQVQVVLPEPAAVRRNRDRYDEECDDPDGDHKDD